MQHIAQCLFCAITFAVVLIIGWFDFEFDALKDDTAAKTSPYSFGRVQVSWWTVLIFSAFAATMIMTRQLPNLDPSLIFLLGISGGTTIFSKGIDIKANQALATVESNGFINDILNSGDIHRLQTALFNVGVGVWFFLQVIHNLTLPLSATFTVDMVMPAVPQYVLVLLTVSNSIYLGAKIQE